MIYFSRVVKRLMYPVVEAQIDGIDEVIWVVFFCCGCLESRMMNPTSYRIYMHTVYGRGICYLFFYCDKCVINCPSATYSPRPRSQYGIECEDVTQSGRSFVADRNLPPPTTRYEFFRVAAAVVFLCDLCLPSGWIDASSHISLFKTSRWVRGRLVRNGWNRRNC